MREEESARAVLERDLQWLLDRDPDTLGADQRRIREMVAQLGKKVSFHESSASGTA